jgi:ribonucleoside-diphosphate reductase alpha chain
MTETVGTDQEAAAHTPQRLSVRRVYTTEGVHPYDEVTWEHRDVVMTNWRDGSVNFEQRGVEFPESSPASTSAAPWARRSASTPCASSSTAS